MTKNNCLYYTNIILCETVKNSPHMKLQNDIHEAKIKILKTTWRR